MALGQPCFGKLEVRFDHLDRLTADLNAAKTKESCSDLKAFPRGSNIVLKSCKALSVLHYMVILGFIL